MFRPVLKYSIQENVCKSEHVLGFLRAVSTATPQATSKFYNQSVAIPQTVSIPQHVHDIPMTVEEFERKLDEQERSKYLKLLFNEELPNVKLTNDHLPKLNLDRFLSMDANTMQSFAFKRKMKIHKLSKHLILHSPVVENRSPSEKRPLVVLCSWLMAKQSIVDKYCSLYTDLGIDVLQVSISPADLLMPVQRAQLCADEVLDFLLNREEFGSLFMHGMSVAVYTFTEVLIKISANPEKYGSVRERFVGQVYDSPCELPGVREGVVQSLTRNKYMQEKLLRPLDWVLLKRYESSTRYYVRVQKFFNVNYCGSPALFLYSKVDPISAASVNTNTANSWHRQGFQVHSCIFENTPHVGHFGKHKQEYRANIYAFLENVGMLQIE